MWHETLRELMLEYRDKPHVWGETDCCQFVSDYVERITGHDFASSFDYYTREGALSEIARFGTIDDLAEAHLGKPNNNAKPGDVVTVDVSDGIGIGIYNGHYVFATAEGHGLCRMPEHWIRRSWTCHR